MSRYIGRSLFWIAFTLAGVFALRPIWSVRFLPLLDLPQHLSVIHILRFYTEPAFGYEQFVELRPGLTTYLTYYFGSTALAHLMSVEAASKVFLSAYLIGLPLSLAAVLKAFGRNPWFGLFGFPLAYSFPFYMGFISFCLSLPLVFVGIALWESLLHRATWTRSILALVHAPLLFFTHALGFLIGLGAIGVLLAAHCWRRPLLALKRASLLTLGLVCFGLWVSSLFTFSSQPDQEGENVHILARGEDILGFDYKPLDEKLTKLPERLLSNYPEDVDEQVLVGWGFLFLAFLLGSRRSNGRQPLEGDGATKRDWLYRYRIEIIVWLFCALYFAAPMSIPGIWAISPRLPVVGLAALVLLLDLKTRHLASYLLFIPILALSCYHAAFVQDRFEAFQQEVGPIDEMLDHLPDGMKVYGLIYDRSSEVTGKSPYLHFACYYMLGHGGMTNFHFVNNPAVPIQLRNPSAFPYPGEAGEWHPERFRFTVHGEPYNYFLIRDRGGQRSARLQRSYRQLELVAQSGEWSILHNPEATRLHREVTQTLHNLVSQAEVSLVSSSGEVQPCDTWAEDRWQCPPAEWMYVGNTMLSVAHIATPCIWAHPIEDRSLIIEFEGVEIEDEVTGFVAFGDSAINNNPFGAPVTLTLTLLGERLGRVTRPNEIGIQPFRFDTSRWTGLVGTLRLTVDTTDDAARHFCFDASIVRHAED